LPFSEVVNLNTPVLSVVPPSIVFSRYTFAPLTGLFLLSITVPLILYCASAIYVHKSIAASSIIDVISRGDKRGFMCFSAFCRKARPLANYFKLYSVKYWLWSVNTAIG
jgi:hypothetical protein